MVRAADEFKRSVMLPQHGADAAVAVEAALRVEARLAAVRRTLVEIESAMQRQRIGSMSAVAG